MGQISMVKHSMGSGTVAQHFEKPFKTLNTFEEFLLACGKHLQILEGIEIVN